MSLLSIIRSPIQQCPTEVIVRLSLEMSETTATRLSLTCRFLFSCRSAIEKSRRDVMKEEMRVRFSPLNGLFQTVRSYQWQINQVINRRTLVNRQARQSQIDHLLVRTGCALMAEYRKTPSSAKESGPMMTESFRFTAELPVDGIVVVANDYPRWYDAILLNVTDYLEKEECFVKATIVAWEISNVHARNKEVAAIQRRHYLFCKDNELFKEAESVIQSVGVDDQSRKLAMDLLLCYLKNEDFARAIGLCGRFYKSGMQHVAEAFVRLRLDIDALKEKVKSSSSWDDFLVAVCGELAEDAPKIVPMIADPKKRKKAKESICEVFAKQGKLNQILAYVREYFNSQEAIPIQSWNMIILARSGHFEQAMQLLNMLPPDAVIIKSMAHYFVKPELCLKAKSFAHLIADENLRQVFIDELDKKLS
jgi:hypothetical protein